MVTQDLSDARLADVSAAELPNEDEAAPLLGGTRANEGKGSIFTQHVPTFALFVYPLYLIALDLGQMMPTNAQHQAVEEILCREILGLTDAAACGASNAVQGELAIVTGWYETAMLIPGLLFAIPYGLFADRYGQRPSFVLNALGMALVSTAVRVICFWPEIFPVRLIWLAPLLFIVGGGYQVSNSLIFANIGGLTTDASRSSMYSLILGVQLGPRLIINVISSRLIDAYGPWVIMWLSLGFSYLCIILGFFFIEPERKPKRLTTDTTDAESQTSSHAKGALSKAIREATSGITYLAKKTNIEVVQTTACLIIMGLAAVCSTENNQLLRRRFGWTWAKLEYVSAMKSFVIILTSLVLLPAASYIMSAKFSITPVTRELTLGRICVLFVMIGATFIVFAQNSVTLLIGIVFWSMSIWNLVLRCLLILAVGENSVMLFTCFNTLEGLASLIVTPGVAYAFKYGLKLGGVWISLSAMMGGGFALLGMLTLGFKKSWSF